MSSLMLVCLFIVMSLFTTPNLWVIAIPFTVILYSYFQIRRCSRLARMIRQALAVQSQIDKAQKEAEERDKAEAEAKAAAEAEKAEEAERVKPVIEALSERDVADPGGANGSGSRPPDPTRLSRKPATILPDFLFPPKERKAPVGICRPGLFLLPITSMQALHPARSAAGKGAP